MTKKIEFKESVAILLIMLVIFGQWRNWLRSFTTGTGLDRDRVPGLLAGPAPRILG